MTTDRAPSTATTPPHGLLVAGLLGPVFLIATWIVSLVSMWSGLVWGLPPKMGGIGMGLPATYGGVAVVALVLGGGMLVALYTGLRAARVHRPLVTLLTASMITLAVAAAYLALLSPTADDAATSALALLPLLLISVGAFAGAARLL